MRLGPIAFVNYLSNPVLNGGKEIKLKRIYEELRKLDVEVEFYDMWNLEKEYRLYHVFGSEYYLWEFVKMMSRRSRVVVTPVFYTRRRRIVSELLKLGERIPGIRRVVSSTAWGFRKALLMSATMLLPNCKAEAQQLKDFFNVSPSKMRIIPSGVDNIFMQGEADRFYKETGLRDFVLCVARVESRKNQLRLLKALKGTKIKVVLIGPSNPAEPSYAQKVKKMIESEPNFCWFDAIPYGHQRLRDAFKAARVHALPSLFDAPGQASLQAGLAGLNIVVGDVPPVREYFKDFAFYADPLSEDSIRNAVLAAWETPYTEALSSHILENYTWDKIAKLTLEVYKEVLES